MADDADKNQTIMHTFWTTTFIPEQETPAKLKDTIQYYKTQLSVGLGDYLIKSGAVDITVVPAINEDGVSGYEASAITTVMHPDYVERQDKIAHSRMKAFAEAYQWHDEDLRGMFMQMLKDTEPDPTILN